MALDFISQVIVSIICFLGLYVGLGVGALAKEELVPGRKMLILLQRLLFSLIIFFVFYDFGFVSLAFMFLVFFFLVLSAIRKEYPRLLYNVAALFLFASFSQSSIIVPVLVFFYGLPAGSLHYLDNKKDGSETIITLFNKYISFLVIVILLAIVKAL